MSRLDPKVAIHNLVVKHGVRLIKQEQCRFWPELLTQIEVEVNKLIKTSFIREVKYPTWISNTVPMKKKNGKIYVCIDFRDLNDACPKDDCPILITKLMVDAIMSCLLWMAHQTIIKFECHTRMRSRLCFALQKGYTAIALCILA